MRKAEAEDYELVQAMQHQGTLQITWPNLDALRAWSRQQAWSTPWFGFKEAFLAQLYANQLNFVQAISTSGIELSIPLREYTLTTERQQQLDALYAERSSSGRPVSWGALVEELREIRRAVEAGVVIQVEAGPTLRSWQGFYAWAHGRYHMLEDGADQWIGDDN
jgi:hypothetical protein